MSILIRLAALFIVVGLVVGLILRVVLKRVKLRVLMLLALVPWLVHEIVIVFQTRAHGAPVVGTLMFAAAGLVIALTGAVWGWRAARRRRLVTALMPLIVAVAYAGVPFAIYVGWLRRWSISVDALTTVAYVSASLFAASVLVVLAPRAPQAPQVKWRWPRLRR